METGYTLVSTGKRTQRQSVLSDFHEQDSRVERGIPNGNHE